jgi:hypothetical protein
MTAAAKRAGTEREATWSQDGKELAELIEGAIDRGAHSIEEIHRSIAKLPLQVMEGLGLFERTARDVERIQEESIGAVYDGIRHVNREVGRLATELLEARGRVPTDVSRERAKRAR